MCNVTVVVKNLDDLSGEADSSENVAKGSSGECENCHPGCKGQSMSSSVESYKYSSKNGACQPEPRASTTMAARYEA